MTGSFMPARDCDLRVTRSRTSIGTHEHLHPTWIIKSCSSPSLSSPDGSSEATSSRTVSSSPARWMILFNLFRFPGCMLLAALGQVISLTVVSSPRQNLCVRDLSLNRTAWARRVSNSGSAFQSPVFSCLCTASSPVFIESEPGNHHSRPIVQLGLAFFSLYPSYLRDLRYILMGNVPLLLSCKIFISFLVWSHIPFLRFRKGLSSLLYQQTLRVSECPEFPPFPKIVAGFCGV